MGSAKSQQLTRKGQSLAIVHVGIDVAKNVFAVHGAGEASKLALARPAPEPAPEDNAAFPSRTSP
jgi:transposase